MVKQNARILACLAQTALLCAACNGDDTGDGSATATTTSTSGSSTSTTSETTSGSSSTTDSSGSSSTSSSTTSTTTPETSTTDGTSTGGMSADAFRFTEMYVRDPHFYIVPLIGCEDITDKGTFGIDSINKQFNDAITMDTSEPPDGNLNMNFLLLFRPLDQAASGGDFDFATGDCTAPIESTVCDVKEGTEVSSGTYSNMDGVCLEPVMGELSPADYMPKPGSTNGPCFAGDPLSFTLDLGDFKLPFIDAEIAAQYVGDPADGMVEGLMRGFLSEEDASNTFLPDDIPVLGGTPISNLIPGNDQCCAKHDDRDIHMGASGWWFYIEFKAARVDYIGD
ncbi:MAG: hypothetical protein KC486_21190 [Myxococcales bacterium]|nr:hypothetical protein [Myxococcales bacterium]